MNVCLLVGNLKKYFYSSKFCKILISEILWNLKIQILRDFQNFGLDFVKISYFVKADIEISWPPELYYRSPEPRFLVLSCVWRKPLVWPKPVLTCGHPQSASVYLCYSSSLSPTLISQLGCLQNSFVTIEHFHHWLKSEGFYVIRIYLLPPFSHTAIYVC